jgi:hypothetical protein
METPVIDPNGTILQEIRKLQNKLQEQTYLQTETAKRILNLQRKVQILVSNSKRTLPHMPMPSTVDLLSVITARNLTTLLHSKSS